MSELYKRIVVQLFLGNMLLLSGWFCVKGMQMNRAAAAPAFHVKIAENDAYIETDRFMGQIRLASSGQRVVDYTVLSKEMKYMLSDTDYEALLQIVQAEAGNEDEMGKMLVAGVILNRVDSKRFPNTVIQVVFQQENGVYQFSPVSNGTYQRAKVSQETIDAVEKVLMGQDLTEGALYFVSRKYADPEKMRWFDNSLRRLFEHGGHEFYTNA